MKVVADADRGILVGACVASPAGGEVVGLLATAVHAEVPVATLKGMHFAYPTFHRTIESALWTTSATCEGRPQRARVSAAPAPDGAHAR